MLALPVLLQGFYASSAASILLVNSIPALRNRFVNYGKTSTCSPPSPAPSAFGKLLDFGAALTVPHHYFWHFYAAAIANALFWGWQVSTHGAPYQLVASRSRREGGMRIEQVILAFLCFLGQTGRRLYECLYIQKPDGTSRMWIGHYISGLLFYTVMSVAIWVEGTNAIEEFTFTPTAIQRLIDAPSLKSLVGLLAYFLASGMQHDCHIHLASLKKYSLPTHPFFRAIVCPHYSAECLIYAAIAVVAAPKGSMVNLTVWSGLVFVAVILGVSAKSNREWYRGKFGESGVAKKWNMLPGVF